VIVSIGIDIIEISRIQRLLEKGDRFKNRIYTDRERKYCDRKKNSALNYAARFAAKEAFLKALGTGLSLGVSFKEVEVVNDEYGKPELNLYGKARALTEKKGGSHWHVSLSHLEGIAAAVVILEK